MVVDFLQPKPGSSLETGSFNLSLFLDTSIIGWGATLDGRTVSRNWTTKKKAISIIGQELATIKRVLCHFSFLWSGGQWPSSWTSQQP